MPLKKLVHLSVLQKEVLKTLITPETRTVFDGTLGLGGHAELILSHFPQIETYIGVDLDKQHLTFAQNRLKEWETKTIYFNQNFSTIREIIETVDPARPIAILLDLGLCSNQLDDPEKGFSFRTEGPLDMSFGVSETGGCETMINTASAKELRRIFREYGEEPGAHRLSQKIVMAREHQAIKTTSDLRSVVEKNTKPQDLQKTLMRVFQALRIATNDELGHLEKVLAEALVVMKTGDRIGVMSFHSLEDRMVKKFFRQQSSPITKVGIHSLHEVVAPAKFNLLTKKPIVPTKEEISENPRARSVKFRIAEKI